MLIANLAANQLPPLEFSLDGLRRIVAHPVPECRRQDVPALHHRLPLEQFGNGIVHGLHGCYFFASTLPALIANLGDLHLFVIREPDTPCRQQVCKCHAVPLPLAARSPKRILRLGILDAHLIGQPLNLSGAPRELGNDAGGHPLDFPAAFSALDGVALSCKTRSQASMKRRFRVMRFALDCPKLRRFPPRLLLVESRVEGEAMDVQMRIGNAADRA